MRVMTKEEKDSAMKELEKILKMASGAPKWRRAVAFALKQNPALAAENKDFVEANKQLRSTLANEYAASAGFKKAGITSSGLRHMLSIPQNILLVIEQTDLDFKFKQNPQDDGYTAADLCRAFPEYTVPEKL